MIPHKKRIYKADWIKIINSKINEFSGVWDRITLFGHFEPKTLKKLIPLAKINIQECVIPRWKRIDKADRVNVINSKFNQFLGVWDRITLFGHFGPKKLKT